jgi:hypothetical protein
MRPDKCLEPTPDERAAMASGARAFYANLRDSMIDGDPDELIRTMVGQVKAWHA